MVIIVLYIVLYSSVIAEINKISALDKMLLVMRQTRWLCWRLTVYLHIMLLNGT